MTNFLNPTIKRIIFLCIILASVSAPAQASSPAEVLNKAEELNLADHPTWLKLLHYERGKAPSVVLTDEFFLSPSGRNDPKAELIATINGYFSPWGENTDEHARCRFPARYFWLSQQLVLPDYKLSEGKCQRLEEWGLFNNVNSISLLLVSGYLGNPASTFGHALLKLNTDSNDDKIGLFDLTLNFGAMLPEKENPLRYVARGLMGGYKGAFSDRYFYTQDLVYSRTEFRDMWDYKLVLSDYERILLNLHIWELVGKNFNYYFLDKNCAYRLAELIELVIEEELLDNVYLWYVPEQIFNRLNDIDRARQQAGKEKLVESVRYIPSSQRVLYQQLKLLTADESEIFNDIVREGIGSMSAHLSKLPQEKQILILDSLLAYQQYRLVTEGRDPSHDRREAKDKILLARLQLPIHQVPQVKIPELSSPAEGSRPMETGIGYSSEADGDPFLRLTWSPYKKESVGSNSLGGNEVVVFDLAVGLFEDEHEAFVDKFDLIRISNLNTLSVKVADESALSWQLRIGSARIERDEEYFYDGVASFGAGYARKWNQIITSYGMIDVAAHTQSPYVRLRPHFGLQAGFGKLRTWLYGGVESADYDGEFRDILGGKIQYQLNDRNSIYLEVSNENATRATFSWNRYW